LKEHALELKRDKPELARHGPGSVGCGGPGSSSRGVREPSSSTLNRGHGRRRASPVRGSCGLVLHKPSHGLLVYSNFGAKAAP
jgi:hypothetical protein